jgi:outer membrane protein, heavy metal efflux system
VSGWSAAEVEASAAAIPVRARDIVADIKRTYAEIFVARKAVDISQETIGLLRQIADATQVRYAAGRGSQQDVLKTVVEITRLHEEELMLVEQARMAEARLNTLLGRDPAIADRATGRAARGGAAGARRRTPGAGDRTAARAGHGARRDRARRGRGPKSCAASGGPDYFVRGGYMLMPGEPGAFTAGVGITWNNAPWSRGRNDLAEEEARLESRRDARPATTRRQTVCA